MHNLTLEGLDGSNPLAFLAALGVLEVAAASSPAELQWRRAGTWQPTLTSDCATVEELAERLDADRNACAGDPALDLEYDGKRDIKPRPERFREYLSVLEHDASATFRRSVDWAASFATDVAVDNNGNAKPTALHFTAGPQQFLQMIRELRRAVTKADFVEALQGPWRYQRPLPVMGWDATDFREYALRATNPSTDKKLGVPGADWLAVRGLGFYPVFPRGGRVLTTGCSGGWKTGRFCWPLWTVPLPRSVIRSLLAQDTAAIDESQRQAMGIGAVFSASIRRSDQGGYGSFAPSMALHAATLAGARLVRRAGGRRISPISSG